MRASNCIVHASFNILYLHNFYNVLQVCYKYFFRLGRQAEGTWESCVQIILFLTFRESIPQSVAFTIVYLYPYSTTGLFYVIYKIFICQSWRRGTKCDCKLDWLWVRSPLEEIKYIFTFIFSFLRSGVQTKRGAGFRHLTRNVSRQKVVNERS